MSSSPGVPFTIVFSTLVMLGGEYTPSWVDPLGFRSRTIAPSVSNDFRMSMG